MSQIIQKKTSLAINKIKEHGGWIRMADALKSGINRRILYSLRDQRIIEQMTRGFYRLAKLPSLSSPDITTVMLRVPESVICLVSALSFHGITIQFL
jgi:predicted transcriptional regulator of viral defense system